MVTLDKILTLLKEQSRTQKELCEAIGVKKSTFTHWKSADNSSYKKYLPEIAEFFNVSVDYLISGEKNEKPTVQASDEPLILLLYNKLSESDKLAVKTMIESLLTKPEYAIKKDVG